MAEKKEKATMEAKPGFMVRFKNFWVRFGKRAKKIWRDYISEMRKVVWMPWKDVKKNAFLVIVAVVASGAIIGVVDYVFAEVINGIAGMVG
ncbi:MAG: preprotein translocase subunit SecE [Eubacteriales bacterium]